MDIHRLDQAVQTFYAAGLTSSTHKTYRVAECRHLEFVIVSRLPPYQPQKGPYATLLHAWNSKD